MTGRDGWRRAGEWYAAGLFLAYVLVLFGHRGAPSLTDYANWTYQGVLLRNHLLGRPDAFHVLKRYPVPNSAETLGIGLLALVLPWTFAAKAWLCVQLAASFGAMRHLFRTLGGCGMMWVILPQAVFLNVNFWYGFMNFELGLCWVLLTASTLLRRAQGRSRRDWVVGGLLVAAFFTHMIAFGFAGLLVMLFVAQTGRSKMLWQLLPGALLTAWYVAGRYLLAGDADGQTGMETAIRLYSARFWEYKVDSYLKSFGLVNPEGVGGPVGVEMYGRVGYLLVITASLLLSGVMGWVMVRDARRAFVERVPERFLWIGIGVVLPVYLLVPGSALGVSDPGARLLQVALALGLGLCARASGRCVWVGAVCGFVLAAAGLGLFVRAGFGAEVPGAGVRGAPGLPGSLARLAHVPNRDQDYFYWALERGDMRLTVFPTGLFLNLR